MSESQQFLYYIIVSISALFVFYKKGLTKESILIVLIFWSGLFQYADKLITIPIGINNIYKISVVFYSIYICIICYYTKIKWNQLWVYIVFFLFSISYWISYALHGGDIITIASQYMYKYGFVVILFYYFNIIQYNSIKRNHIESVILMVLVVQVFLSFIKLLFIGIQTDVGIYEPIVGSISAGGAGSAVVIPIISLIFYWVINRGNFTKFNWLIAISFLVIAISSAKRQPVLLYPIFLFGLFVYAKRGLNVLSAFRYAPIVILLIYVGIKINPTLNPEGKVWGSFDIEYVVNYVVSYYFGVDNVDYVMATGLDTQTGRGGALFSFANPRQLNLNSNQEILFGKGRYEVATGVHGRFTGGESDYGLQHEGLMGEAGVILYSLGYMGTAFMILLSIAILNTCQKKRIAILLLIYYLWDFLFYYNQVFYSNTSALLVVFIIYYLNSYKK